jgi:hypothetical protein
VPRCRSAERFDHAFRGASVHSRHSSPHAQRMRRPKPIHSANGTDPSTDASADSAARTASDTDPSALAATTTCGSLDGIYDWPP